MATGNRLEQPEEVWSAERLRRLQRDGECTECGGEDPRIMCSSLPHGCVNPLGDRGEGSLTLAGSDPIPCGECQLATAGDCPDCAGTGNEVTARLRLMAYAGDEAAVKVLGYAPLRQMCGAMRINPANLSDWLSGLPLLATWAPKRLGVLVALASAWAALKTLRCEHMSTLEGYGCSDCENTGYANLEGPVAEDVLRAAEAWLACPCEPHSEKWRAATDEFDGCIPEGWIPAPQFELHYALSFTDVVDDASKEAGFDTVRAAICERLIDDCRKFLL